MKKISWKIPIKTVSEANSSEHWTKKAKRHKSQKDRIKWQFRIEPPSIAIPCDVLLTRIAPRFLDVHDNLPGSLKYIADSLAECITGDYRPGRADDCKEITWTYAQQKGKVREYAVLIEIEWDL